MKISVKLLNQKEFSLEVNPEDTIENVKRKIEKDQQHPVDWQKLIFSGQILEDNKKIGDYSIKENDFLVLMVRKPKAAPAKPKETPKETPKPTEVKPQTPIETKPSQEKPPETTPGGFSSGLVTGSEYETAVQNLCAMGFERDLVVRAMRAAFNNPERAAEYLSEGYIPEIQEATPQGQPSVSPSQTGGQPQSTAFPNLFGPGAQQTPSQAPPSSGTFDALRQHPQFNALRQLVQQNPQLLQHVLQQLGQQNPQLLQLINQHQNEFIQLLNEPIGQTGGQPSPQGTPTPPPGTQYIQVSEEEREAISRLESMGFDRAKVIEAFFACEKDENLAANYLLEHAGEDEENDQNPTS